MRNKAQLFTSIGIMLLVIGSSFLVGTIYRSTYTSGGMIGVGGLGDESVSFRGPVSLAPRYYTVELNLTYYDAILNLTPISSVDFYLLDSKGSELWLSEGVIDPVWFAKDVPPVDTLHMQIPHRGDYFFLFITPDGANMSGFMWPSLSGYESDLLWFSVITLVLGSIILVATKLGFQSKNKQLSSLGLKKGDQSNGGSVLLSEKVESGVSSVKREGRSRFGGQLRKLLVWELEECFAFPMLEVILVVVVLSVLTPAIIEFLPEVSFNNLLSGIQPIFLFLIFMASVLFCHSYAGSISRGETKMVLSYPVQRSRLFLSKFIALFVVLSVVYVGVFALQVPLLALNPLEPMFYASMLLLLLQLFLVCSISTVLSVVSKNEVLSILASALLLFGIESVVSGEGFVTFTGRFTNSFSFVRGYVYGGLSSISLFDVLVSVFVVVGVSVVLFVFSYVYFTRRMEID